MNLIHNEKVKLTSFNLNLVGAGCTLAGIVVFIMENLVRTDMRVRELSVSIIFVALGIGLHTIGRLVLDRLREDTPPKSAP